MASRLKRTFSLKGGKRDGVIPDTEPATAGVLPSFDELPSFHDFKGCAWDVWGKDDELGTINLLTPEVVARAAQEEIRLGRTVSLNWPIHFPSRPVFGRKIPSINTFSKAGPIIPVRDDVIHINTQSGCQWDGLKHFGVAKYNVFYNNTPANSLSEGEMEIHDPSEIDYSKVKLGMHNWANHGICGRGVLLDVVNYYTANGEALPYDPWTSHPITVAELEAIAKKQGVEFRQGDILLLRVGFIQKYYASTNEAKADLGGGSQKETFETKHSAGIEQSEDMKRFLWNNHFSAIASDQPALERWPTPKGTPLLHQTILALYGMPIGPYLTTIFSIKIQYLFWPFHDIGEFFDLEALSELCQETGRYTFFFTSWPLNILGGAASPPNAAAYF
ncbi:uncharacterized protein EDB91DRAFT_1252264 [Suillus paluster]|uniref:uncharacterized protein n=1 Tax=Suillus paluster TaxID=48578 RepID=UPI001B869B30|nr:uncharacterized protein EDB91DRAFT_1252264 [Suillus paluster]KAG1731201.1 hypothetical protein EDB91DRAFT_1252264 [Suillus paluster]